MSIKLYNMRYTLLFKIIRCILSALIYLLDYLYISALF